MIRRIADSVLLAMGLWLVAPALLVQMLRGRLETDLEVRSQSDSL